MKILRLNIYFELPDNFQGGLNEALEEYIKYRKEKCLGSVPVTYEEDEDFDKIFRENESLFFDKFLEALDRGDRTFGSFALSWYDNKNSEWIPLGNNS